MKWSINWSTLLVNIGLVVAIIYTETWKLAIAAVGFKENSTQDVSGEKCFTLWGDFMSYGMLKSPESRRLVQKLT